MKFTKSKANQISKEIIIALEEVAKKHNIQIKAGSGTFEENYFDMKIKMLSKDDSGEIITKEAKTLENNFPQLVGLSVDIQGRTFELSGYKKANRKFPFLGKSGGKTYKLTRDQIKNSIPKGIAKDLELSFMML